MGNSNGIITSPVSLHADVYPVLGLAKTGTYYDLGYVCKNEHGKINKWSKRKPVKLSSISTDNNPNWHQGEDGNYGFLIPDTNSLQDSLNQGCWKYISPIGGNDSPYRLSDFEGYNHNAKPFLHSNITKGTILNFNKEFFPYIRFEYIIEEMQEGQISLSDLAVATINPNESFLYAEILSSKDSAVIDRIESQYFLSGSQHINVGFEKVEEGSTCYVLLGLYNRVLEKKIVIPDSNIFENFIQVNVYSEVIKEIFIPTNIGNYIENFGQNYVSFSKGEFDKYYVNNDVFLAEKNEKQVVRFSTESYYDYPYDISIKIWENGYFKDLNIQMEMVTEGSFFVSYSGYLFQTLNFPTVNTYSVMFYVYHKDTFLSRFRVIYR